MAGHSVPQSGFGRVVNEIEESAIALILGMMTLITFVNVILRYGFNTGLIWGLEAVTFLFAWLVLFGVSYAVKVTAHLGVDAVTGLFPAGIRKVLALISATVFIVYAFLLLKGAWDYWANFANLPQTTGRWFPTGFETDFRANAWYEVNDIPMPQVLRFIEPLMNDGDEYEKIPRFLPYAVLPLSMAMLLFRFAVVAVRVWRGDIDRLVASHEVEDEIAGARAHQES